MKIAIRNGVPCDDRLLRERGFQYGDGVFETMLATHGRLRLYSEHIERLKAGLARLKIPFADRMQEVQSSILQLIAAMEDGPHVLKLVVTRGESTRGYPPAIDARPNWWLSLAPLDEKFFQVGSEGTSTRICRHTLSQNVSLAGIKHLNRLDQVLCSMELDGEFDLVACDPDGRVIEGIKSNLILQDGDQLITPDRHRSGVSGVALSWLMKRYPIMTRPVCRNEMSRFSSMAFVNSVVGVVPVHCFEGRVIRISEELRQIRKGLGDELGIA